MSAREFGNYVVRGKIGEGGMGEVYLAEHRLMGRKAAVKVLRRERCGDAHGVERFFNEARAAAIIDHPGIVQIFDCDVHDDGAYLIMEYLEGESLATLLSRCKKMSADPAAIRAIGAQIANVLAAAHEKDIVHRDLKPDNVFLESKPGSALPFVVRILDFGIAKLVAAGTPHLTKSGTLLGTPTYMAPEQCAGDRDVDRRADIYSLGCILFEMAAGRPPFVSDGVGSLIAAHIHDLPPSVGGAWPDAPAAFVSLVAQMLAKDPDQRPQAMGEVEARLRASLAPSTVGGSLAASLERVGAALPVVPPTEELPDGVSVFAPASRAADPTARLPSSDSVPAPTVSLPTGNGMRPGDPSAGSGSGRAFLAHTGGRKARALLAAAAAAALALALGIAGIKRGAGQRPSFQPLVPVVGAVAPALPAAVGPPPAEPEPRAAAPDSGAPMALQPASHEAGVAPVLPSTTPSSLSPAVAKPIRKPLYGAAKRRSVSTRPIDKRSNREVRGFTDF